MLKNILVDLAKVYGKDTSMKALEATAKLVMDEMGIEV